MLHCVNHTGFPLGPSSPGRPRPPAGPAVPGWPASPFSPRSPRGPWKQEYRSICQLMDAINPSVKVQYPENSTHKTLEPLTFFPGSPPIPGGPPSPGSPCEANSISLSSQAKFKLIQTPSESCSNNALKCVNHCTFSPTDPGFPIPPGGPWGPWKTNTKTVHIQTVLRLLMFLGTFSLVSLATTDSQCWNSTGTLNHVDFRLLHFLFLVKLEL